MEVKSKREVSLKKIVDDLVLTLNEKEIKVINGRFGLGGRRETLSSIGNRLGLSRERIRQIEKNALRKLTEKFTANFSSKVGQIEKIMKSNGGIIVVDDMPAELTDLISNDTIGKNYLKLAMEISGVAEKIDIKNVTFEGYKLKTIKKEQILKTFTLVVSFFKKNNLPYKIDDLIKEDAQIAKIERNMLESAINLSQDIVIAKNNLVGLRSWPSVNPRNVRDKIYYVLKTNGKPMHFKAITEQIREYKFDKKRVVQATVHNELIADKRFILIGRGIYALTDWGYSEGTVFDVLKNILSNAKSPLSIGEVVAEVNKCRKVKKNTIIINLQTKKCFKRTPEGYIYVKK